MTKGQNDINQSNDRHYAKLLEQFHKSPAGDSLNIPIDLLQKNTAQHLNGVEQQQENENVSGSENGELCKCQ